MSEWRDMERRHAVMQLRKMQAALDDSRKIAAQSRRFIRYYQRKIDDYEWELQFNPTYLTADGRESMARAVDQLKRMQATQLAALKVATATEQRATENLTEVRRQLEKLDRWKRCTAWLEELFWPITIIRAICAGHARKNK